MEKLTRRTALLAGAALALPTATAALPSEHPMERVRRLGREMSTALKDAGDFEYAYIRPTGVEFPVLLANKTEPGHLADMYFSEYYQSITQATQIKRERHIRQLSHLLSELLEISNGPEYLMTRPQSVGEWAVYSMRDV